MYRETYQPFMFVDKAEELGLASTPATVRAELGTRAYCKEDTKIYVKMASAWVIAGGAVAATPWTPSASTEYPTPGDTGDTHLITGLKPAPYTTTTAGPNGEPPIGTVLDNGDRLVQNAGGGFDVIPAPKISPKVPDYGIAGVDYKADTLVKSNGVIYVVVKDFTGSGKTITQEITAGNISELHGNIQSVANATAATGTNILKDDIIVDLSTGTSYIVLVDSAADTIANLLTPPKIAPMGGLSDVAVWKTATDFAKDSVVIDGQTGSIYRVDADYTSGATVVLDIAGGSLVDITASGIPENWTAATAYKAGQLINDGSDNLMMATKDFTSKTTLVLDMAIVPPVMVPVSKPTKTEAWVASTVYTAGTMVYGPAGEGLFVVKADYTSAPLMTTDITGGALVPAVDVPQEIYSVVTDLTLVGEIPIDAIIVDKATGMSYQTLSVTAAIDTITSLLAANKLTVLSAKSRVLDYTPAETYVKDTILIDPATHISYITLKGFTATTLAVDIAASKLEPISKPTKTEPWITATDYIAGSMVYGSGGEGLFVVEADYRSGADIATDVAAGDLVPAVNIPAERGGVLYDATLQYKVGDITTEGDKVFRCITAIIAPEAFNSTKWIELSSIKQYADIAALTADLANLKEADIVAVIGESKLLRAQKDGPAITEFDLIAEGNEGHLVLDWVTGVDFLKGTLINESDTLYIATADFTSGADVATDIAAGNLLPVVDVPEERGGLIFDILLDYKVGDIVTENGIAYRCITDNLAGAFDATEWESLEIPERGGVIYDITKEYIIGDIASEGGIAYRCIANTTGAFSLAAWESLEVPERGGIAYDATMDYLVGDIVSEAGVSYRCITDTTGVFAVAAWESLEIPERGGIIYDAAMEYKIGDTVSLNAKLYVALADVLGSYPATPGTTDWVEVTDGFVHKDGSIKFDDHVVVGDGSGPGIVNIDSAVGSPSSVLFRDAAGAVEGRIQQSPTGRLTIEQAKAEDIEFVLPADQMLTSKVGGVWHGVAYNDLSSWAVDKEYVGQQIIEHLGKLYMAVADYNPPTLSVFEDDLAAGLIVAVGKDVIKMIFTVADNATALGEVAVVDSIITDLQTHSTYQVVVELLDTDTITTALASNSIIKLDNNIAGAPTLFQFDYKFRAGAQTTADIGKVSLDTADATLATTMYINKEDRIGRDKSLFLAEIAKGDYFNIHEHDDTGKNYSFDITGDVVFNDPIYTVPVQYYTSSPAGTIGNNERVDIMWKRAATFLGLDDTPSAYATHAGQRLVVNAAEDSIEFRDDIVRVYADVTELANDMANIMKDDVLIMSDTGKMAVALIDTPLGIDDIQDLADDRAVDWEDDGTYKEFDFILDTSTNKLYAVVADFTAAGPITSYIGTEIVAISADSTTYNFDTYTEFTGLMQNLLEGNLAIIHDVGQSRVALKDAPSNADTDFIVVGNAKQTVLWKTSDTLLKGTVVVDEANNVLYIVDRDYITGASLQDDVTALYLHPLVHDTRVGDLVDTPDISTVPGKPYSGARGKGIVVNHAEDGFEYKDATTVPSFKTGQHLDQVDIVRGPLSQTESILFSAATAVGQVFTFNLSANVILPAVYHIEIKPGGNTHAQPLTGPLQIAVLAADFYGGGKTGPGAQDYYFKGRVDADLDVVTLELTNATYHGLVVNDMQITVIESGQAHNVVDTTYVDEAVDTAVLKDGSRDMDLGYSPMNDLSLVTKKFMEDNAITTAVTFKDLFNPTAATEYPPTNAEGDLYIVNGLTGPYVFAAGDLAGSTVNNGDSLIHNATVWLKQGAESITTTNSIFVAVAEDILDPTQPQPTRAGDMLIYYNQRGNTHIKAFSQDGTTWGLYEPIRGPSSMTNGGLTAKSDFPGELSVFYDADGGHAIMIGDRNSNWVNLKMGALTTGAADPTDTVLEGTMYYQTNGGRLWVYVNGAWTYQNVIAAVNGAPSFTSKAGDIWYNTNPDQKELKISDGTNYRHVVTSDASVGGGAPIANMVYLTQAQYDAIVTKHTYTVYLIHG